MNIDEALRLGVAHHRAGRLAEAESIYRQVLSIHPGHAGALNLLGGVAIQAERFDAAVDLLERAITASAGIADYHANLGIALRGVGRQEDSVIAFERAIRIQPEHAVAHFNLGTVKQALGELEAAASCLKRSIEIEPRETETRTTLAAILLQQGRAGEALDACALCLGIDPHNTLALALKGLALSEVGERAAASHLLGLDRLIRPVRIDAPDEFSNLAQFNRALSRHVLAHPSLNAERGSKATRFGRQTGDLLVEPRGPVAFLEPIVNRAIAEYLAGLPRESDHPYLASAPASWELDAWAVVLDRQGHQSSHMHGDGWVSGVYYVQLPDVIDGARQEGWIEFGRAPEEFHTAAAPEIRALQPEEGLMFLFPSYVHHRTIPFDSEQARISIAFDAIPLWDQDDTI